MRDEMVLSRLPVTIKHQMRRLMPRRVCPHRILTGPLRGRRLVTSWHDYPAAIVGYTEGALLNWLRANVRPSETWIDVGAHYGYTALALSELVGAHGRVFAFEPVLSTAGHLTRTRALNDAPQLTVVPMALGSCRPLQVVDVPLVRGMADHVAAARADATDRVLAVAFDEIWPAIAMGDTKIHGIKIDVQGMEIEVLVGMKHALLASRPLLVVELHHGVDRHLLVRLLTELGYGSRAQPIEPGITCDGSDFLDNRSYCFLPA